MSVLPVILAELEISPKAVFAAIFIGIWLLSAFVSWMNKQQQEARRRQVREQLERDARIHYRPPPPPSLPPPLPVRPAPPRRPQRIAEGIAQRFPDVLLPPAPPPPLPQQQQQQRRPAPPRPLSAPPRRTPKQQPRRAIPVAPVLEEIVPATPTYVAPPVAAQPSRPKPQTVDAKAVATWLKPATLRQQFILTEILQPPLAVRPDPHERA